ncbi:MAG: DUF354 domain-containing protein [Nitrososphaerota archaeon]|nr:DUF354 domain-containing protein [Nitrososphaerota archaeon]
MVKLWIDALTPKQALFSKSMVERAPSKVKCIITTRNYAELNRFVDQIGLEHESIGRHGGGELKEKLVASVRRQKELISYASKHDFDVSLSYLSPEAARICFGLGIKHYVCSDSPHANAPCRLAVPLSAGVFSPFVIRKEKWTQYGVKPSKVHRYHALDPWAWLINSKLKSSPRVKGSVIIRMEEWFASYFKRGKGVSDTLARLVDGIRALGDYEITLLPRYDEQREWAKRNFGKMCKVPETTVDGAEAISKTDLLIGGGATMTQEAALLGVPNISYFPSANLDVFTEYYFPKKLSIEAANPHELLSQTFKLLKNIDREKIVFAERAQRETKTYVDPVRFIFDHILS